MALTPVSIYATQSAIIGDLVTHYQTAFNDHTSDKVEFRDDNHDARCLVAQFPLAASYRTKRISSITLYAYFRKGYRPLTSSWAISSEYITFPLANTWDETTVTNQNVSLAESGFGQSALVTSTSFVSTKTEFITLQMINAWMLEPENYQYGHTRIKNIFDNGICFAASAQGQSSAAGVVDTTFSAIYTSHTNIDAYKPRLLLICDDAEDVTVTVDRLSPSAGYVPKYAATRFSWSTGISGMCVADVYVASTTFKWKANGVTHSINCGTNNYCDVPANTFTTNSIDWCVEVTDNNGHTVASDWKTLSTAERTSTATINSPANTIIDGTSTSTFSWNHIITTGTAPTGADLQKSNDGGLTWTSLATVTGSATTTTIPANTFSAGEWMWRVRTYNTDNVAGAWSNPASFISVAAPTVQGVTATFTPRPVISWQSDGQIGYQVKIGEYDLGQKFGTANSIKSPIYLDDGSYVVYVRVRNQYGLWSPWVNAPLNVSNVAGDAITLTAVDGSGFAALSWSTDGTYESFLVYRDGVAIARVNGNSYEDHLAIGSHSYSVKGIIEESDNYGISNTVSLDLNVPCLMIADLKAKVWLPLTLSSNSMSENSMSFSSETAIFKNHATAYPVAETTKFKNKTISFRVAFLNPNDARGFEGLIGRMVIVKTQRGDMVTGALTSISKTQNHFFDGYTGFVQHTFIPEEILL